MKYFWLVVLIIMVILLLIITIISIYNIKRISKVIKKMDLDYENDQMFISLVKDILEHKEFLKLRQFIHHKNTTTYDHSLHVSYIVYLLAKSENIVVLKSITRGALLHDFYLYDWHHTGEGHRFHGFRHAYIAYRNAKKYFTLDKIEKDIILTHMFPLTFYKIPRYKVSWLVSYVDKYVSMLETKNIL